MFTRIISSAQTMKSSGTDIAIQATEDSDENKEEDIADEYDFTYPFLFSDMVLVVQDYRLHCHRAILSLYSPVFKAMFQSRFEENAKNQVIMPTDDPEHVRELLRFLYTPGGRDMDSAAAQRLLPLIHRYQIDSLVTNAERTLTYQMTDSVAPKMLCLADLYGLERLRQSAIDACSRLDMDRLSNAFLETDISTDLKATVFGDRVRLLEKYITDIQKSFTHACFRMESRMERVPINHCQEHNHPLATKTIRIGLRMAAEGIVTSNSPDTEIENVRAGIRGVISNQSNPIDMQPTVLPAEVPRLSTNITQSTFNETQLPGATGENHIVTTTSTSNAEESVNPNGGNTELTVAEMPIICENCVERSTTYIKDLCKKALHKTTFVAYKP